MIEKEEKKSIELQLLPRKQKHGEQMTKEGFKPIQQFLMQYELESLCASLVNDVQMKILLLIMKITTFLLMLCGYASHATNNATRS